VGEDGLISWADVAAMNSKKYVQVYEAPKARTGGGKKQLGRAGTLDIALRWSRYWPPRRRPAIQRSSALAKSRLARSSNGAGPVPGTMPDSRASVK